MPTRDVKKRLERLENLEILSLAAADNALASISDEDLIPLMLLPVDGSSGASWPVGITPPQPDERRAAIERAGELTSRFGAQGACARLTTRELMLLAFVSSS